METPLRWLLAFFCIAGVGYGALKHPEVVHGMYRTYFVEPTPPKPEPDMSNYIELKPVEVATADGGTFGVGKVVYVAGSLNVMGWDETDIALYYTYDGSPENDKQAETFRITHGAAVKILDSVVSRGTRWYRIQTVEQFSHRGWIPGNYLRASKPANAKDAKDWGTAKEKADKARKARQAELERQKKMLEEARKQGAGG